MIDFNSSEFLAICQQEIASKGYCYLREHLSRCGGMTIDYLIRDNKELNLLPVRSQSLWHLMVVDELHPLEADDFYIQEEGSLELKLPDGKLFAAKQLEKATVKQKALVYKNGKAIMGVY
jgi:hypothetical protein